MGLIGLEGEVRRFWRALCRGDYITLIFCKDYLAAVWETDCTEAKRGGREHSWRPGSEGRTGKVNVAGLW